MGKGTTAAVIGRVGSRGRVRDAFAGEAADAPAWAVDGPPAEGTWVRLAVDGDEARVETVLASPGSAAASLWELAAEEGVSPLHPPAVMAEAAAWTAEPDIDDPDLDDLRHLGFATLDEPTSRDLDQALYVEDDGGGWVVWYAIADAAHFVRPGSALFAEALERGATYYLPGLVLPMLPPDLSEDLVSLGPDVDRRALVFRLVLDDDGAVADRRLLRARVRSRLKTSYDAVQRFYDGGEPPTGDRDVLESLERLRAVGEARLRRREADDVIEVRRREVSVSLGGDDGRLGFVALADPRLDVERYNEQISLLANVEGARFLARGDRPDDGVEPVYRYHEPPDRHRLRALGRQIDALVRLHGLDPGRWRWHRGRQSLADYLRALPDDGATGRVARAIHRQALIAGGRAGFDVVPGVHHGVGAEVYARFTAPMREIVGVFTHKETWEKLELEPRSSDDDELRQRVVEAADRARHRQRRLDKAVHRLVLDQLFESDRARGGTILGITRSKVHVQLDDPPIDVKVYHRHLADGGGRPRAGRDGVTLRRANGSVLWRVGDAVRLRPAGHDARSDRWRLELLAPARRAPSL